MLVGEWKLLKRERGGDWVIILASSSCRYNPRCCVCWDFSLVVFDGISTQLSKHNAYSRISGYVVFDVDGFH